MKKEDENIPVVRSKIAKQKYSFKRNYFFLINCHDAIEVK